MRYFITLFLFSYTISCSNKAKDEIVGRWQFEKFEVSDKNFQLSDSLKEMRSEMEKANQGLIFSFQKDGMLSTYRRSGDSDEFISTTQYKLKSKNAMLLTDVRDGTSTTVNIHLLSKDTLKISFYPNQYDIGVFKKITP